MPTAILYLAHLDRGQFIHRIVDARNGAPIGLRSNLAIPMGDAFCSHMSEDRAPRLCNDVPGHELYGSLPMQRRVVAGSYLGVPLELSDGTRVGSLAAIHQDRGVFGPADEQLFSMLARSAVFEPVLRDGIVAGVLIVIWQAPLEALPDAPAGVLRLLAAQAAVAIEHANLHSRVAAMALTDPHTGLVTRRVWEDELPRELARARRAETPLAVALLD